MRGSRPAETIRSRRRASLRAGMAASPPALARPGFARRRLCEFGLGLLAAALVLVIGAPFRWIALRRDGRAGEGLPVLFHRIACAALAVRVRVHGRAASARPQLVVSNHISWLDICALGSMRPVEFLAKKEVGAGRLARAALSLQGVAFVDRGRRRCIPAVNAEIARRLRVGAAVVLFAEFDDGRRQPVVAVPFFAFRSGPADARRRRASTGDRAADLHRLFPAGRPAVGPFRATARRLVRRHDILQSFLALAAGRPDRLRHLLRRPYPVLPGFRPQGRRAAHGRRRAGAGAPGAPTTALRAGYFRERRKVVESA